MFYGCKVDDPTLVPQKLLFLVPHPLRKTHSCFGIWTVGIFLSAFLLLNSHKSRQNEAEAEQAERQTDG